MSNSSKIQVHFDKKTVNKMVNNHVMTTMSNESIMIFQESLLLGKTLEQALYDATFNEIFIKTLETALK